LRKGGLGSQRQNVDALPVWPSFGFFSVASGLAVMGALPVLARPAEPIVPPSPTQIVEAAPPGDWVGIPADHLLVVDLAPDAAGQARRVIIQLMNGPWSQGWIGNIRKLAAAHWWDGTSVNRVQDGYVVQWGDPLGMTRPAPSRCRPDCSRSRRGPIR
jgi:hypothetical protein